ncbi:MAG: cytochrome P450 [Actinomycetia bacterium]|nr:cytochrome P450 [Actinomycetes bacterium]MCP4962315.1 cytochrome P450 [Actinomycetes bacterium]
MTDSAPVLFNPLEAGYLEDPYETFAELRREDPVHQSPTGSWILFDYDDVFTILRDPAMSVDDRNAEIVNEERRAAFKAAFEDDERERRSILGLDPPDHNRLRRLISKAFSARTVEGFRPRVQELVDAALERIAEGGDVIEELAFPLPFDVISEMLGMPAADKDMIRDWSGAIVKTIDPIITPEEVAAAAVANREMSAHLAEVVAWKRDNLGDDLLSAMIQAEEDGDQMSAAELRDQVSVLFIAGHETTVNLIGGGVRALVERPDQRALLTGPDADAAMIEELLRFVSPVQFSRRITLEDTEIKGRVIPKGSFVLAGLASANHDEKRWGPDADELDLNRADTGQHMAFGSGIHYCLGASLAKLEGQIAIGSFARRFPNATITDYEWNGRINLRGLDRLAVEI